jgi:hypothetical protein
MGYFLAFPVLTIMIMLQMAIFSRLMLLHGTADLIMLSVAAWTLQERVQSGWFWALLATVFIAYVSVVPPVIPLIGYFGVMGVARLLQIRIWQTSILAMFIVTIVGTVIQHLISIIVLNVADWPIPFFESLAQVTLPSILFNLFLALPVYVLLNALARVVYPAIES